MVTPARQPPEVWERLFIELTALVPLERVTSFNTNGSTKLPEELFRMMPNIETLHISYAKLSKGFLQPNPDGPHATKLLPSLRLLRLRRIVLQKDDDWVHLMTFLAHQTSDGQAISLEVIGEFPHNRLEVANGIKDLVKELIYHATPDTEDE